MYAQVAAAEAAPQVSISPCKRQET